MNFSDLENTKKNRKLFSNDIIVAIATPPGRGGVGIVRISGFNLQTIIMGLIGRIPKARYASYCNFLDTDGTTIDQGIALFFPNPHSFTGEDILEIQGHGGPVVMDMLLNRALALGARIARPGEFSERAFLNDKIDLAQAEAIADLIDSVSQEAVKGAVKSLQGEFSNYIRQIDQAVLMLRLYVEAAIDFPEEEINFLSDDRVSSSLLEIETMLDKVSKQAKEGAMLKEGITLILAGRPNVGKSSLMNQLSGRASSIVTTIAGTTRDLVNEYIHLDGIPLKLVDTAGIRDARDEVEEEGIRRALSEIDTADGILLLIDLSISSNWQMEVEALINELPKNQNILVVLNKIDLLNALPDIKEDLPYKVVMISALNGSGLEDLKQELKRSFGVKLSEEGTFVARSRHLDALSRAYRHVLLGKEQLHTYEAGELLAEELRLCHECLCEITGEFTSDELLGEIFSSFCIGK